MAHPISLFAVKKAFQVASAVVAGYDYDPGDSDLDNEQHIHVRMTLGQYRDAMVLVRELEKSDGK